MKKNNRRDFIGKSLMGLPLALFTESIFHSIVNKAMGEETALSDMNFLSLYFPSGPARWCFDLPLGDKNNLSYRPQSTNVNTMLINSFITNANGIVGGEFKQTFFQGEVVPWIWESQVSDENGNLVPLKPMLQNMLMAQGLNLSAMIAIAIKCFARYLEDTLSQE
jgi:hypothetical protein